MDEREDYIMSKIRETELTEILKEFDKTDIFEIEFENDLTGYIKLKNTTIKYDEITGFINIVGKDINLKINTTLVYMYEKNKNGIKIELESLIINIKKM